MNTLAFFKNNRFDKLYFAFILGFCGVITWPVYKNVQMMVVIVIASLSASSVAYYCSRPRKMQPGYLCILLGFAGYLVFGFSALNPTIYTSANGIQNAIRELVMSPIFSWKQLATLELPVGNYSNLLSPLFTVIYICSFIAVTIYLRYKTKVQYLCIASFAVCSFGVLFGAKSYAFDFIIFGVRLSRFFDVIYGLVYLVITILWLNLRQNSLNHHSGSSNVMRNLFNATRNVSVAIAILFIGLALSFELSPGLAGNDFRNLRGEPTILQPPQTSELDYYRLFFKSTKDESMLDKPLLQVEGELNSDIRLTFATLPHYDGTKWSASSVNGGTADEFHQFVYQTSKDNKQLQITNLGLPSPWIPTSGEVSSVNFGNSELTSKVFHNKITDSFFLANDSIQNGTSENDYTKYEIPANSTFTISYQDNPGAPESLTSVDLKPQYTSSELTPNLLKWLNDNNKIAPGHTIADIMKLRDEIVYYSYLSRSLDDPRLGGIKSWLPSDNYTFAASMSGASYSRIEGIFAELNKPITDCQRDDKTSACGVVVGDEQQLAAAIALIADSKGFDTRMVVGSTIDADGVVYGRNLRAWAEIRANGSDIWTPIYAEPRIDNKIPVNAPEPVPNAYTTDVTLHNQSDTSLPDVKAQSGNANSESNRSALSQTFAGILNVVKGSFKVLSLTGIILVPLLVIILLKRVRRRLRMKVTDAESAITSGWEELVDFLVDNNYPKPDKCMTRKTYISQFSSEDMLYLANLTDRAIYGEIEPSGNIAMNYWQVLDDIFHSITSKQKWWQKVLFGLNVRSLLWK